MRSVKIEYLSYEQKDKVKTTVKDKCKKINSIHRRRGVEAVTTIIHTLKDSYMFNCALF